MKLKYYTEMDAQWSDEAILFNVMDLDQMQDLVSNQDADSNVRQKEFVGHYFIFSKTGRLEDLDIAIRRAEGQIRAKFGSPDYVSGMKDLVVMLLKKYEHTDSVDDLQEAISWVEEMMTANAPTEHPDRPALLNDKIAMLGRKYEWTGRRADLRRCMDAVNEWGR